MRPIFRRAAMLAVLSLVACADGPTNGGGEDDTPGPPAAVAGVSGSGQQVPAGQAAPAPLTVKVTDSRGRAVPNATVSFTPAAGSGTLSPSAATTGADGHAQVSWTVGASAGTHTVTATVGSLAPATFTANVTPNATIAGTVTLVDSLVPSAMRLPPEAAGFAGWTGKAARFGMRIPGAGQEPERAAEVPGALIVTLRADAIGAPAGGPRARMSREQAGRVAAGIRRALDEHAGPGRRVRDVSPQIAAARMEVAPGTEDAVAAGLRRDPRVRRVERDVVMHSHGGIAPNDPMLRAQAWHYQMIDLPRAWKRTTGSSGVLVAVVDDGTRFDHPDLAPNLTSDGYDFVSDLLVNTPCGQLSHAGDGNGYDPDPTTPVRYNGCSPSTAHGHGLHVAGTIGAVGNNDLGMAGVAWQVRIRPVRVLGAFGGSTFDIVQGLLYAAGLPASDGQGGVVQAATGARIINMSLGGPADVQAMRDGLIAATSAGALVVASVGNSNSSTPSYPGAYPEALGVSAVNPRYERASYSNYGPHVDIGAPGGDFALGHWSNGVSSTLWNFQTGTPTYNVFHGTSMAAPHVAGAAALLLAQDPSLTAAQLRQRLLDYAVDLGPPGPDPEFGAGLLNVRNSLTQSKVIQARLFGRVYDASTGAIVRDVLGSGNTFSIGQLPDAGYHVFAGLDDEDDGVFGINGSRWGGLVAGGTLQTLAVQGAGTYPATFSIGFGREAEPNDASAAATRLMLGSALYGTLPGLSDVDHYRVNLPAGTYVFETVAWEGACGLTLNADTELTLLGPTGTTLATNDDVDESRLDYCSRVSLSLAAGTYTVAVKGYTTGGYRVMVRPA